MSNEDRTLGQNPYEPIWTRAPATVIAPRIKSRSHGDEVIWLTEFGYSSRADDRSIEDSVWAYESAGHLENSCIQYRHYNNAIAKLYDVIDIHPYWRCLTTEACSAHIEGYLNSCDMTNKTASAQQDDRCSDEDNIEILTTEILVDLAFSATTSNGKQYFDTSPVATAYWIGGPCRAHVHLRGHGYR